LGQILHKGYPLKNSWVMKEKTLWYLLLVLIITGCTKEDIDLAKDPEIRYVRKIESVAINRLAIDTTWDSLPPLTGSFSNMNQSVAFQDPFTKAYDSLYLYILKADTSVFNLAFDQPVILPDVTWGKDKLDSFLLPNDSLQIEAYETRQGFMAYDRRQSHYSETYTRSEGQYVYRRLYQRIQFAADVTLKIIDDRGNLLDLSGRLRGSKVGQTRTSMNVY
jgi:hypothetical protein